MSLSIHTPSDDAGDIRQALASWLDDYIDGRCERAEMKAAFLDVGRSHPEAPWDALALLDQYQRLGRLDGSLVRELKGAIAQLVFGPVSQPVAAKLADNDATLDAVPDEDEAHDAVTNDVAVAADHELPSAAEPEPEPEPELAPAPLRRGVSEPDNAAALPTHADSSPSLHAPLVRPATGSPRFERAVSTDSEQRQAAASENLAARHAVREQLRSPKGDDASAAASHSNRRHAHSPSSSAPERARHDPAPPLTARVSKSPLRSNQTGRPFVRDESFSVPDDPVTVWPAASELNDASLDQVHVSDVMFGHVPLNDEYDDISSHAAAPVRREAPLSPMTGNPQPLNVGDVLRGRYELLAMLGRGRTGIVYQALDRHRAHLTPEARQVAIKVLAGDYRQSPELLARLETEFHQAQSLSHPNVTRIFDLDRDGDTYFIVMELLQGELLSELKARLRGHPMQQQHALAIVSAVGAALAHAHRRGIVHGDVRPENIMITRQGEIRVLDFGFAGARELELHSAAAMPRTQAAYASVERANGSEPHASDDVYSLACIAYELLSGRHPFGGRSAPLARAHGRKPRRIAGLNSRKMQVLQRALLWARGERSIDVVELLAGLGCGEAPAQLGTLDELAQPADGGGRRRWLIAVLILMLAALAAAAWWWFGGSRPAPVPVGAAPSPQIFAPSSPTLPDEVAVDAADGGAVESDAAEPEITAPTLPEPQSPPAAIAARSSTRLPVIEFDKDTYVVSEGDGMVRLTIHRSGSVARELTFSWVLRPNSALAGSDYADIGPGVERIPAGVREVGLSIPLVQDTMKEGTEMFLAQLQVEDEVAQLGERSSAAIIIVDDD